MKLIVKNCGKVCGKVGGKVGGKVYWICLVLMLLLWGNDSAIAGVLGDRLAQFPNWESKPPVEIAQGDLLYPEWMAGTWEVRSTLVDLVAPLAPKLITPGFESNRQYLERPIKFLVKFGEPTYGGDLSKGKKFKLVPIPLVKNQEVRETLVVADRAFNGLNIAQAYLGDNGILSVKVDPENPNRQITVLRGDRQLVSVVTGRLSETIAPDEFLATEITQQIFHGQTDIYLNEVESTTRYQLQNSGAIAADQITAIYLSPQDPDYFNAAGYPVALYRYQLELLPVPTVSP